jgi:hypothetical protein
MSKSLNDYFNSKKAMEPTQEEYKSKQQEALDGSIELKSDEQEPFGIQIEQGSEPTPYIATSGYVSNIPSYREPYEDHAAYLSRIKDLHAKQHKYDEAMQRLHDQMEEARLSPIGPSMAIPPSSGAVSGPTGKAGTSGRVGSRLNPFGVITTVNTAKPSTGGSTWSKGVLYVQHHNGTGIKYDMDDNTALFIKDDGTKHELSEILELGYKALRQKEKPFDAKEAAKTTKLNFNGIPIYRTFNTIDHTWAYRLFENTEDAGVIYIGKGTPAADHIEIIRDNIKHCLKSFEKNEINISKVPVSNI